MCGRYVSISSPEQLQAAFEVDAVRTDPLPPRYNVAPSREVYAVIERRGQRRLGTLRWGFVPAWVDSLRGARTPINARLETVATTRMFADAFARRRCLLPADGFYEWQAPQAEGAPKRPHHLHHPAGDQLAFAGIWSSWRDPAGDGAATFSAAIVTTAATGPLRRIHHRVPLILPRDLWSDWLSAGADEAPHLEAAVHDLGPPELVAMPVSTRVNNVRNEGPELLEPATTTGATEDTGPATSEPS